MQIQNNYNSGLKIHPRYTWHLMMRVYCIHNLNTTARLLLILIIVGSHNPILDLLDQECMGIYKEHLGNHSKKIMLNCSHAKPDTICS